ELLRFPAEGSFGILWDDFGWLITLEWTTSNLLRIRFNFFQSGSNNGSSWFALCLRDFRVRVRYDCPRDGGFKGIKVLPQIAIGMLILEVIDRFPSAFFPWTVEELTAVAPKSKRSECSVSSVDRRDGAIEIRVVRVGFGLKVIQDVHRVSPPEEA